MPVAKVCDPLRHLRNVHLHGDYHVHRLESMSRVAAKVGATTNSAPFQSLETDRDLGYAEWIVLTLDSTAQLDGQMRESGFLAGNARVQASEVSQDNGISHFVFKLRSLDPQCMVEMG